MTKLICCVLTVLGAVTIACVVIGCSPQQKESRYMERANRYYEEKQFDKAQTEYLNVVRLNRRNTNALTRLGMIASDRGDLQLAYVMLIDAAKLQPTNLAVRSRLGKVYLSARRPESLRLAREEALFVLERDPLNAESILVLGGASVGAEV